MREEEEYESERDELRNTWIGIFRGVLLGIAVWACIILFIYWLF